MAGVKWSDDSAFIEGGEAQIGDKIMGLRLGVNYKFDFPSDGIKDGDGNYLVKWETSGANAVNAIGFTNSDTGVPLKIEATGSDTDISIDVDLKGAGVFDINGLFNINGTTNINAILDEDTLSSNSATALATQQSIKSYVDSQIAGTPTAIVGTQFQVLANGNFGTNETGTVTLTTPQNIDTASSPSFAGMTLTGVLDMSSQLINNVLDPVSAQDAATKAYVDSRTDLVYMEAVQAASTGNFAATYDNGASGVGATLTATSNGAFTLDGQAGVLNARYLMKDQSTTFQNGIYTLTQVGDGSNPAILTRATDFDQASEIDPGDIVPVLNGTVNASTSFIQTATVNTVGTDAITFSQWSANFSNVVTIDGTQTVTGNKTFSGTTNFTGDVGIDTASPASKIDITADSNSQTDFPLSINNLAGSLTTGYGAYGISQNAATDFTIDAGATLNLETGSTLRMKITSGGNVGIGESSPQRVLHVSSTASPIVRIQDTGDAGSSAIGYIEYYDSAASRLGFIGFGSTSNSLLTISNDLTGGGINCDVTATGAFSVRTSGTTRADVTASGLRLGAANARVTTILDEDTMSSDSATALATQQSIKAYVDNTASGITFTEGTDSATTSGTTVTFSSIPSGTKVIYVQLDSVSVSSAADLRVQLGDSGGIETSGYDGTNAGANSGNTVTATADTTGFLVGESSLYGAAAELSGTLILTRKDSSSNEWAATGSFGRRGSTSGGWIYGGTKELTTELTQLRLITSAGTFDNGSVNILYA